MFIKRLRNVEFSYASSFDLQQPLTTPSNEGNTKSVQAQVYVKARDNLSEYFIPIHFSKSLLVDREGSDHFFTYTSGRWLWNEEYQLKQRTIQFNVQALQEVAAHVIGANSCVEMSKLGEGNFNKNFLLKMDNDIELIARIPHPNADPPHFTTASEVATLSFLRDHLKINVPKVFGWSSKSSSTPVGAEYILMERARGVELSARWETLDDADRARFLKELFPIEKKLAEINFPKVGCL